MTDLQKEKLSEWYKTGKVDGEKIFEMSAAQKIGVAINELFGYRFEVRYFLIILIIEFDLFQRIYRRTLFNVQLQVY